MAKNTLNIDIVPLLPTSALDDVKKRIASILGKSTNVEVEIEVDDKEVKDSFKSLPKDADKVGDDAGKKFGSSFTSGAKKLLAGAAIFSVLAVGASAVKNATGEFRDFNAQLQNVESLGVKNVDALGKKLNELSKTTVDTTSNLTGALYQAVSAGVSGTQDQLVGFIDQASKVAVAGNATTEDAVNSLTSVLNSYKLEVGEAGKVSDIFFGAIKGGKTDFGQLNASLSNVIPAAAAAGVSFEEVAGNLAQMTALGTPTAQATTQLRAAIVELQKPGKDLAAVMSGVTVEIGGVKQKLSENNIAEVIKQQGLTATLQQVEQAATLSGKSMTQVFSSTEAAGAALLLTGENAETANKQLENIKKGIEEGVSTSAFEAQFKSLDNQMKLVKNNIQAGFNTIFTALLPVVNNLLQTILPIIQTLFDGIIPVIEDLASTIGPLLNNVIVLIQPLIDLLSQQLAPIITNIIGKLASLLQPLASLLAPIFQAINDVFAQIAPVLDKFVTVLVDGLGQAINGLVPLISLLASTLGGILGDVLELVLNLFVELVTNNLELINVVVELIVALTPVIQVVLELAAALIKMGVDALKPLIPIIAYVVQLVGNLTKEIIGGVLAIGEFLGLIDKKPKAEGLKETKTIAADATKEIVAMNKELANPEPAKNATEITTATVKTGKAHKDNTKYVVDYFKAFKEGQDELERMAKLEDEITRIREERSKSTKDEIAEQSREIDALLDYRNKLAKSLADGFVINDAGKKIKITADEKVDLTETLANLDSDLKFASKNLEKLTITAEIDDAKLKRETEAKIAELQRERLEIEVDMGIKPKTDLLAAYKQDLEKLNVAITGAETVEQEKLQNEKLKKLKQINAIEKELNQNAADSAAAAYRRSFLFAVETFEEALDGAFQAVEPNTDRNDAINNEIKALDEKKAKTLKDYKDGIISAQQYNSKIVEIEADRVSKVKELNNSQLDSMKILTDGLSKAFTTVSEKYQQMAKENLKTLNELSKKEQEYQKLQSQGVAIPAELQLAHEQYGQAASDAISQMAVSTGSAFASMLLEGKNVAKSLALLALDTLDSIIPVLVAQIFGQALAQLGPIGGAVAAATGIGLLKGLVAIAKSSFGGAYRGVYKISESNKGKPGPGDTIPTMLKKGESVATVEATNNNPVIAAIVRDKMTEEQYYNKVYLPKTLAKFKINMPSIGMSVLPADLNEKSYKQLQDSAKWIKTLDEKYKIIDQQRLSIAIKRDAEATEFKKQNQLLTNIYLQQKADNELIREEIRALKGRIKKDTKLKVQGKFKLEGKDLQAAIEADSRRRVY